MPRVMLEQSPFAAPHTFDYSYALKSSWIGPASIPEDYGVWAFRRQIDSAGARIRIHTSADQRYILYHNGVQLGRGPERGDLRHWIFESYDIDLNSGPNTLVAIVWWLSLTGTTPPPAAQATQQPGFWLMGDGEADAWSTGKPGWQITVVDGISPESFRGVTAGPRVSIDGTRFPWGVNLGTGGEWAAAKSIQPAVVAASVDDSLPYWLLRPSMLPAMRDKPLSGWSVRHVDAPPTPASASFLVHAANHLADDVLASMRDGPFTKIEVGPAVRRRVIVDLERYACAYARVIVSGGRRSCVRMRWAEALYKSVGKPIDQYWEIRDKNNRNEIEGRHFIGIGDSFLADGAADRAFEGLWWNAGRYVELLIETADEAITIQSIEFVSTGYPYTFESRFEAGDTRLETVRDLSLHTLSMCSHETSMDCPYYEQLNYAGDTRLQSLVAMTNSRDDRLVRKSLQLFDWSRSGDTWSASRWPSNRVQTIPPFAMWWTCMAYDYALWRGDLPFVRTLMPGVRAVLECWREQIGVDGLLRQPPGWNFVDWVKSPSWANGMPNPQLGSPCGVLQWQLVYTLAKAAELEDWLGEPLLAQRNRQTAAMLAATAERAYFDHDRQLFAADLDHTKFCEHSSILALLSGQLSANLRGSAEASIIDQSMPIDRTTIYFQHYLFEALAVIGRGDLIIERLAPWFEHSVLGMSTLREAPEPSRSDCHAWSAHPAYHFFASIVGIRPAAAEFKKVCIRPRLGSLRAVSGEMVHPLGTIRFKLENGAQIRGEIELPPGLSGELILGESVRVLNPGVVHL